MTLKSFPRGGKKLDSKPTKSGLHFNKKEVAATKTKKNRGRRDRDEDPLEEDKNYIAKTAECLTYTAIAEGTVLLGRIQNVTEYEMTVTLPGRLRGSLQVTEISEAYTNLLQTLVKPEEARPAEFKALSELYKKDEYVVCYVKSVNLEEKCRVGLSLEPDLINRNLDPGRLSKGAKIVGTISSVEDHGYVVDTGIDNLRTFLGVKDIDERIKYYPGKQVFCAVKTVKTTENSTTAQLSTRETHVTTALKEDKQSLDALVPGSKFSLGIQEVLSNGLQVAFNNGNVGYINRAYLDKPLGSYERGREVIGTLMYVMPTVKFAYFTLLPSTEEKERLTVGATFEGARVLYTGTNGIVMSLQKGIRGLVPFLRTEVPYEKIPGVFTPGSTHKCRVLAYDSLERVYVCTMQRELLDKKNFSTATLSPGELLDVEIVRIQPETGYLMVNADRITGWVTSEHIRDVDGPKKAPFKVGDVVKARVLGRDMRQKGVLFTLKKSLIESRLPVLQDIKDAEVGSKYDGTIVQINAQGLLVRFFDRVKGFVPSRMLDNRSASRKWNFLVGQTITATVEQVKIAENKLILSLPRVNERAEMSNFEIGEAVEGTIIDASAEGVYVRITKDENSSPRTGFLPMGHIAPCQEIASFLSATYVVGDTISALVFSVKPLFLLTRTFVPQKTYKDLKDLQVDDLVPCSIHEFTNDGVKVILPVQNIDSYGIVPVGQADNVESLYMNQLLFGKVIRTNKKGNKVELTTALYKVWSDLMKRDSDLVASIDVTTLYLSKMRELSDRVFYKSRPISSAKIGMTVSGVVDKVTEHGLVLKLDNDLLGTVRNDHFQGEVKVGDKIKGRILWINYIHELVEVTLLRCLANTMSAKQNSLTNVTPDMQLRGEIVLVTNWFALVLLRGAGKNSIAALPTRRHTNDINPDLSPYSIGKKIKCYVVLNGSQTDLLPICLLKSSFDVSTSVEPVAGSPAKKDRKRKSERSIPIADDSSKKRKKIEDTVEKVKDNSKKKKKKAKKEPKVEEDTEESATVEIPKRKKSKLKIEEKFSEPEVTIDTPAESEEEFAENSEDEAKERVAVPECGYFWDNKPDASLRPPEESSSDEDEEDATDEPRRKKKKLSAAERREAERLKEREIREREEALASNQAPKSVDQFDRLVLSSPDNSMIWLRYMAHHLEAAETDKARAVAKRALSTINFREEAERLNVWQAWLNLESRFGDSESLESVFQDAVKTNDALKVHLHMLTVHLDAGRQNQLEKIITSITGKFKHVARIWLECGAALLKIGLKEKSRHIMQRALQSLPPQEHVNLMVSFAQMENKFGDKERAQTLFEQILSSYPKRVDVWSSYVDALVKSEDLQVARKVLERAVVQTLPARKMKTLFKKFIAFEEAHGSPEGVSQVQQLALKYVENQCKKESAV